MKPIPVLDKETKFKNVFVKYLYQTLTEIKIKLINIFIKKFLYLKLIKSKNAVIVLIIFYRIVVYLLILIHIFFLIYEA